MSKWGNKGGCWSGRLRPRAARGEGPLSGGRPQGQPAHCLRSVSTPTAACMYIKKKERNLLRSKHLQYTPSEHKLPQPPAWDAGTHTSQEKEPFLKRHERPLNAGTSLGGGGSSANTKGCYHCLTSSQSRLASWQRRRKKYSKQQTTNNMIIEPFSSTALPLNCTLWKQREFLHHNRMGYVIFLQI